MIDRLALLFMMLMAWLYMGCLMVVAVISPSRARAEIAAIGKTLGATPTTKRKGTIR